MPPRCLTEDGKQNSGVLRLSAGTRGLVALLAGQNKKFSTKYIRHVSLIRSVASASVFLLAGWFMTHRLDVALGRNTVARWCALAEARLEHLTELFETGRWRRYHSEVAFLENIREAKAAVETWRDLLSREASRDNSTIDMTWLNRTRLAARPIGKTVHHQPRRLPLAPIPEPAPRPIVVTPAKADPIAFDETLFMPVETQAPQVPVPAAPAELLSSFDAIERRYPLLRNAL
jgi:uncharacterized repeat protein (TIGR03809 family)